MAGIGDMTWDNTVPDPLSFGGPGQLQMAQWARRRPRTAIAQPQSDQPPGAQPQAIAGGVPANGNSSISPGAPAPVGADQGNMAPSSPTAYEAGQTFGKTVNALSTGLPVATLPGVVGFAARHIGAGGAVDAAGNAIGNFARGTLGMEPGSPGGAPAAAGGANAAQPTGYETGGQPIGMPPAESVLGGAWSFMEFLVCGLKM